MKIENIDIKKITKYSKNYKIHDERQINLISESIKKFGFRNPVLIDSNNVIIAGHGRVMGAEKLGLKEVPCILVDNLSEEEIKAYRIADNKLAELAKDDIELLSLELKEIEGLDLDFKLDILGIDDDYYEELMDYGDDESTGEIEEDEVPEVDETKAPYSKLGDVWLLGRHRLMCGDSTKEDIVNILMDNKKADMVFTDPPYNVAFKGRSGKHDVIKNDKLKKEDFEKFINATIEIIKKINPKVYYIWCNWNFYGILQNKLEYKSCIVWAKNVFGLGLGYRHQHEFCLFNGKIDEHIKNESDLWNIKKDHNYVHPTQKPVELSVRAFSNHIKLLNVLDLFGGSGSTLIGAEQTGRNAYVMELDEKYVDVIVKRYNNLAKEDIKLIRDGKVYEWREIQNEILGD